MPKISDYNNLAAATGTEKVLTYAPDQGDQTRLADPDVLLTGITDSARLQDIMDSIGDAGNGGTVRTGHIKDAAVTNAKIAAGAVEATQLPTDDAKRLLALQALTRNAAGDGQMVADDVTTDADEQVKIADKVKTAPHIASVAALRALDSDDYAPAVYWVDGYYGAGTPGGGLFRYDSDDSSTADNGGTCIVDAASRRWQRPLHGTARLEDFGVRADTVKLTDAAITADAATLTSATASFSDADVGKSVLVMGAGADAATLTTTIDSVTNGTTAVLSDNAGTTVSAATAYYGTDDTTAIQAADDFAATRQMDLVGLNGLCLLSDTVTFAANCNLLCTRFGADSAAVDPVVRIGTTTGFPKQNHTAVLPQILNLTKPSKGWSGAGTGLEIGNLYESTITINKVSGFDIGVDAGGYNSGCNYNTFFVQTLYSNKRNLRLKPRSATGSVNENIWQNGRYGHNSSDADTWTDTRDILLEPFDLDDGSTNPNNNLFLKPSLESDVVEYMLDICGAYNIFMQPRWEGDAANVRFYGATVNTTTHNTLFGGYGSGVVAITFDGEPAPNNNYWFDNYYAIQVGGAHGISMSNSTADANASPLIRGFTAGTNPAAKTGTDTDWLVSLFNSGLAVKAATDSIPKIEIKNDGYIRFGTGSATATAYFRTWNTGQIRSAGNIHPAVDNTDDFGASSNRWKTIYAGTGTISTSDEREKQAIAPIDAKVLEAWAEVEYCQFHFVDSVEKKGADGARVHVGLIAQRVKDAFEAKGLDAAKYGLLCYDEWEAEPEERDAEGNVLTPGRPAGNRYGLRYDECLALECALLRSRLAALEKGAASK